MSEWLEEFKRDVAADIEGEIAAEQREAQIEAHQIAAEEERSRIYLERLDKEIDEKRRLQRLRKKADDAVQRISAGYVNFEKKLRGAEIQILQGMMGKPELAEGFVKWACAKGLSTKKPEEVFGHVRLEEQARLLEDLKERLKGNPFLSMAQAQVEEVFRNPRAARWGFVLPDVEAQVAEAREKVEQRRKTDPNSQINSRLADLMSRGYSSEPFLAPLLLKRRRTGEELIADRDQKRIDATIEQIKQALDANDVVAPYTEGEVRIFLPLQPLKPSPSGPLSEENPSAILHEVSGRSRENVKPLQPLKPSPTGPLSV